MKGPPTLGAPAITVRRPPSSRTGAPRDERTDEVISHRVPHEVEVYVLGRAATAPRQRAHQHPALDRHPVAHGRSRQLREDHVLADARGRVEASYARLPALRAL